MDGIENGIYWIKVCQQSNKCFPIYYSVWGKFLKSILTYLYCCEYNEINKYHSDVQKHVSKKKLV